MTTLEIENIINKLNNEDTSDTIFKRNIGNNVEFAIVWDSIPSPNDPLDNNFEGHKFFLIKNDNNRYVAAIYLLQEELLWYVLPSERKKGILTKALQESIISYLFDLNNDKPIRITIEKGLEHEVESLRVAELLNFKPGEKVGEYFLTMANVDWSKDKMKETDGFLEHERIMLLRKRYAYHIKSLIMISQEIDSLFGTQEILNENLESLKNKRFWINDIFNLQNKN
jgi:hypothetical protein